MVCRSVARFRTSGGVFNHFGPVPCIHSRRARAATATWMAPQEHLSMLEASMRIESIRRVSIPIFESQTRRTADAISQRMLVRGPHLDELEEALCRFSGRRFAVLVGNGFSALLAAIRFASTQPGNVVANPIFLLHSTKCDQGRGSEYSIYGYRYELHGIARS